MNSKVEISCNTTKGSTTKGGSRFGNKGGDGEIDSGMN